MKIVEVGHFVQAILEDTQAFPNFDDGMVFVHCRPSKTQVNQTDII